MPKVRCGCLRVLTYDQEDAGKRVRCPKCSTKILLPGVAPAKPQPHGMLYPIGTAATNTVTLLSRVSGLNRKFLNKALPIAGVCLLVVAAAIMLRPSNKPQPASAAPQTPADRATFYKEQAQKFARRYLDKDNGRTLPDVLSRARADGISNEAANNLLFDAIGRGLVETELDEKSKTLLYKLK